MTAIDQWSGRIIEHDTPRDLAPEILEAQRKAEEQERQNAVEAKESLVSWLASQEYIGKAWASTRRRQSNVTVMAVMSAFYGRQDVTQYLEAEFERIRAWESSLPQGTVIRGQDVVNVLSAQEVR